MIDFVVVLEEELKELKEKRNKLYKFTGTDAFKELGPDDNDLLLKQVYVMESYYEFLIDRLERIRPKKD